MEREFHVGSTRFLGGFNVYTYAGSCPVSSTDPTGLDIFNKSGYPIWYKPEVYKRGQPQAVLVPPHGTYRGEQDGIAIPAIKPGFVYKVVNGMDVTVGPEGSVTWSVNPSHLFDWEMPIRTNVQYFDFSDWSGWQGTEFLNNLRKKGDRTWDELFDACAKR